MICETCQRQDTCLPRLLAKNDQKLQNMLEGLKHCKMRIAKRSKIQFLFFAKGRSLN
jgi:predicted RecB family nuclease